MFLGNILMILHTVTSWSCLLNMALKQTKVNCLIIILKNRTYTFAYPLIKKSKAHKGLQKFFIDVGIPSKVVGDPGGEFMGEEWNSMIRRFHVAKGKTETQSQWQNRAEKPSKASRKCPLESLINLEHLKNIGLLWFYILPRS